MYIYSTHSPVHAWQSTDGSGAIVAAGAAVAGTSAMIVRLSAKVLVYVRMYACIHE
jgi:hypothetical protein